jgi:DNA-binding NtrC family response regulator
MGAGRHRPNQKAMHIRPLAFEQAKIIGEKLAQQLDADQRRIINFVIEHKQINVVQAMRLTGVRWHTIKQKLIKLVDIGVLKHVRRPGLDRDNKAHYVLADIIQASGNGKV